MPSEWNSDVSAPPTPLRRNRDYILLWTGQLASAIGTDASALAFPLLVLALTHSPLRAGIVGFAQTVPNLFLFLPAGALVDRWDRKKLMVRSDVVRALALGSIAVALAVDRLTFGQIVVVALIEGGLSGLFRVAQTAALPQVVAKEQLPAAIAQNQARDHGAGIVSQPLAGFLFSLSRAAPFAFDAITYLASSISLLFIRPALQEHRERSVQRLRAEIAEGLRWLWNERFLRTTSLLGAGINFAHTAFFLVLIVRAKELGASPTLIGVMFSIFAVEALVGSLIATWVQRHLNPSVFLIGAIWLWSLATAALVFVHNTLALGAVAGLQALVGPSWNVIVVGYRYALVPDRLLGRVSSANSLLAWALLPLGPLTAGLLLEAFGAKTTFLVLAGAFAVIAIIAMSARTIRAAQRLETLAAGSS